MNMLPQFIFLIFREENKFQNELFIKLMLWLMSKESKEVNSQQTEESDRLVDA
jgi:hypothetical protein